MLDEHNDTQNVHSHSQREGERERERERESILQINSERDTERV